MITVWEENTQSGITHPKGFQAAGVRCGLKSEGNDLALIVSECPATVAGVFTTNQVQASSVHHSRRVVSSGIARAILCNAGNANACNGEQGVKDTDQLAAQVAGAISVLHEEVLIASTGIIGHLMPMEKFNSGIPRAASSLSQGPETDMEVARAIMTTDTRPKTISVTCESPNWPTPIRFGGVCKGSGMIAPNMATMLCFLTTDVEISAPLLEDALCCAVESTFNRMTVDGDTSTNDMTLVLASGRGGCKITGTGDAHNDFCEALERVCRYLAKEVARDGEGATKLVEIVVRGARSEADAAKIAKTIGESPLVKTALYGCDPNWGRILMAAGRAGIAFDPDEVDVFLGEICVCRAGRGVGFDADAAHLYLKEKEVSILVDLHEGTYESTVWTCDYSYDYIKINAEYHT